MRVTMIGTGYVGLVSGVCFADFGHEVICVDKDTDKIEALHAGKVPIYEPGLDSLLRTNVGDGRLSFTTDLADAVPGADIVFIAVGTPSRRGDGHADLSYVFAAAEEVAPLLDPATVVVTKSTVPVGTGDRIEEIIAAGSVSGSREVASNPEFLREGSAIEDFKHPDRVVVGAESEHARAIMRELYRPLFLNETPVLFTGRRTAELIKYAANAFLATKISFINEMADLCERAGADVQEVARGIGLDGRIGRKFLHAGPGFGGSCFPKDTRALVRTAQELDAPSSLIEAVVRYNTTRKQRMADRIIDACGGSVAGRTVGILGVTFKPNTDDMREAPSLDILPALVEAGATVRAFDPQGMPEASKLITDVVWQSNPYDVAADADVLAILTEWNEFRALDLDRLKDEMAVPLIVDLRNIYDPIEMEHRGIRYHSIGRLPV